MSIWKQCGEAPHGNPPPLPAAGNRMIVMVSNQTSVTTGYLAGRYLGRVGHLYSPGGQRGPWSFLPYALDNGAYSAYLSKQQWDAQQWLALLAWAKVSGRDPRWVLVPDVVGDRVATLNAYSQYSQTAAATGWPVAFAVQDGMTPADVPAGASVIFVGGTTAWKWKTVNEWCKAFPRVHVGRVNSYERLWQCHEAGAESCDGTGWMRGCQKQLRGLVAYLAESSGEAERPHQMRIFLPENLQGDGSW